MTATNIRPLRKGWITMGFIGNVREETPKDRAFTNPMYLVTAKGNIKTLRGIVTTLKEQELLDDRANVFLQFLPEPAEGKNESSVVLEIPHGKATVLQKFLGGWAGSLQRMIKELSKQEDIDWDGDGQADDLSWMADIAVDVSIQDNRFTDTWWGTFWRTVQAADQQVFQRKLDVSDSEWEMLHNRDVSDIGKPVAAIIQSLKHVPEMMKDLVNKLRESAGDELDKLTNKVWEAIKKIALWGGVGIGTAIMIYFLLKFLLAPKPAQQQLPAQAATRRR